ncbi:hypothetical protein [Paraburkholderia phenoliruptrix]|uniref:hypothetical protein n=1 Tax=Paraburkholderia phenoliruptrix TaxID=252970 RepID=UPI0034CE7742
MPVSKRRKPKGSPTHAKRGVITNRIASAGALPAFRALDSIVNTWNGPSGPQADPQDLVGLQGFFLGYDRVCKNAGVPFDPSIADEILDRMHHDRPVSFNDILTLRAQANELLRAVRAVRSPDVWRESLEDMEIYCHIHGWEWKGIGRAPAGSSAGSEKIAA